MLHIVYVQAPGVPNGLLSQDSAAVCRSAWQGFRMHQPVTW